MERAEKEGRVNDDVEYDRLGADIEISSDIGYRDTATWWFWQRRADGFALVDYDEDSGLDAPEWAERLKARCTERGYKLGRIWLPHDAKAKTFATHHSVIEQFLAIFGANTCAIVPQTKKMDKINASRHVLPQCHFNKTRCAKGLMGLRAWSFEWNADTRQFSRDPKHDWASHPGDGFSEGSLMMQKFVRDAKKEALPVEGVRALPSGGFSLGKSLEQLYKERPKAVARI